MALLTSRALATGVTGTDLIHIVITGDTSQNPAGSSYKAEIDQVKDYLSTFFVNSTGNTSGNCITDLYVDNLYGCSPITIHDSLQNISGTSSGITSHAFGAQTTALGDYSHSEGNFSNTGQYGYNSTSIVSGVITLDASYGDVTSEFSSQIILDDLNFDSSYGVSIFYISSVTFGTNTVITLTDVSVNTTQAHIGSVGGPSPLNSDVGVGGHFSHSEGSLTYSIGVESHSEGGRTTSFGQHSHSEGKSTQSFGESSHSEGNATNSYGNYSHAEGISTDSIGAGSHSEGYGTQSIGENSHSEGYGTQSFGQYSHSEGYVTQSPGYYSHAEGNSNYSGQFGYNSTSIISGVITLNATYGDVTSQFSSEIILDDFNYDNIYGVTVFKIGSVIYTTNTVITLIDTSVNTTQAHIGVYATAVAGNSDDTPVGGYYSHSEGTNSITTGVGSHAEGESTYSVGFGSHSEGKATTSIGKNSHSEGQGTQSQGDYSHSEGNDTKSQGEYSHSEGENTTSLGKSSHAEGYSTTSQGEYSHSEGNQTNSEGQYSHAEGYGSVSFGTYSHAEGYNGRSTGQHSHSEGESTDSIGTGSHAEGRFTKSLGKYSHSEGNYTYAGQYGYNSTSIVSGVITLDASYGDVSGLFTHSLILDDTFFDDNYGISYLTIASATYTTNTIITLNDLSINTTQATIGVFNSSRPISSDSVVGGNSAHSEGNETRAVGEYSHSQGNNTNAIGQNSFASGVDSSAIGENSFIHSFNSTVFGNNSVVLGGSGLVGNDDDTVYVPYLNINSLNTGTSINNLGVDSQGNVVVGSAGGSLTPPVTLSGSGITVLTLIGSGDTVPIFEIQGSSGQLFSVTDSLIGSLYSVNNISGLPVLEVFSDNTILMGDYTAPSLNSTTKVTASAATATTIYSIPTSAYTGAFFDYTVNSGTNYRSGNIMSVWDGSNTQYIDSYSGGASPEIGSTSDITFSVSISGGNTELIASATTNNWDVKTIIRSI